MIGGNIRICPQHAPPTSFTVQLHVSFEAGYIYRPHSFDLYILSFWAMNKRGKIDLSRKV